MSSNVHGDDTYPFQPADRPLFPGGPYSPPHPWPHRIGYAAIAMLLAITATLGNAMVTVNLPNIAGELGVDLPRASLLPAAYVGFNACANLLLVKARQQFGIAPVAYTLLTAYLGAGLLHLVVQNFATALLMQAVCGTTAAGLTTMTLYNLLQVVPPARRPAALVAGISLIQLGSPIARMLPVEMLALGHWQGLTLIELGVGLAALAAILTLPLPPSDKGPAFERLDFVTIALYVPAMILFCAVLGVGRVLWWTDTPWLGVALVLAIPLFVTALVVEHYRARPLLQTKWVGTRDIVRFAVVALMVRLALAEQTYGAVGFLTVGGLNDDQLHTLFACVLLSMVVGLGVTLVVMTPARIPYLIIGAALIIALASWLDSGSNSLTRPPELILSQSLIGFGTMLFIGPSLVFGFQRMVERGPNHLPTLLVLFSTTQNVGGLAGSALLGSYQVMAAKAHALALSEEVLPSNPQVAARLQHGVPALSGALGQQANVLAFNDTFQFVAAMALLTALYLVYARISNWWRARRALPGAQT